MDAFEKKVSEQFLRRQELAPETLLHVMFKTQVGLKDRTAQ